MGNILDNDALKSAQDLKKCKNLDAFSTFP